MEQLNIPLEIVRAAALFAAFGWDSTGWYGPKRGGGCFFTGQDAF
jgi:hypothetical protein